MNGAFFFSTTEKYDFLRVSGERLEHNEIFKKNKLFEESATSFYFSVKKIEIVFNLSKRLSKKLYFEVIH